MRKTHFIYRRDAELSAPYHLYITTCYFCFLKMYSCSYDLITTIRRRKLKWFGHVVRSTGLTKTCMMETVRGGRRVGRQRRRWEDNIMEWTGMQFEECVRSAESRSRWRELCWRCAVPLRPQGATG